MHVLALLLLSHPSLAATPTFGVNGGLLVHFPPNDLSTAPTLGLRVGGLFTEHVAGEFNLGYSFGTTHETDGRSFKYGLVDPRVDALYFFFPQSRLDLFARGGVGIQAVTEQHPEDPDAPEGETFGVKSGDFLAEFGGGALLHVAGPVALRTDLMYIPSFGDDQDAEKSDIYSNFEWTIGLEFHKAPNPDKDGDGIKDKVDTCPEQAEDIDQYQDEDGCPELDNDNDGVNDSADKCVNEAEDKDGFQDEDGCPDPDNDADGVPDTADKCGAEPEDKDNFQDDDGCPDPDNDGDKIADGRDQCPNEPETRNKFKDFDGCPDEIPQEVQKFTGVIKGINFETNKAVIKKESFKTLDEAVAVLKQFPDVRMEVQGHTDNVGDDTKNMTLSQARAQSVVDYFVSKGIAADRLIAKGYGETVPKADNNTKAGQAENRRVEFKLVEADEKKEEKKDEGTKTRPGTEAPKEEKANKEGPAEQPKVEDKK